MSKLIECSKTQINNIQFYRNRKIRRQESRRIGVGRHWGVGGGGVGHRRKGYLPLLKALTHRKWSYSTLLLKGVTQGSRRMFLMNYCTYNDIEYDVCSNIG